MINKVFLISASGNRGAKICISSRRYFSEDFKKIKNIDTAFLRRGTGGRSSFNGNVVTVFGATGYLGKSIVNQLGKRGAQIIIPYRCDPDDVVLKKLKLSGDLGQVLFQPFNLKDKESIRKAVKYSNVVINLIGKNFETRNFSFDDVHVKGARDIAAVCRECNVERLIHFSAMSVTDKPESYILRNYKFLPSKLQGERAVLEEFPAATIVRPGAVYGRFDHFLWPLCVRERFSLFWNCLPLYKKGENTIRQPIFVSDFIQGIISILNDYDTRGKIYQGVGPERFYLKDIAFFCCQVLQRHTYKRDSEMISDIRFHWIFFMKILYYRYFFEMFYVDPVRHLAFEYIERESTTDVVDLKLPTFLDLGVKLSKFEDKVPNLIFVHHKYEPYYTKHYHELLPVDSLSAKAVTPYLF